MKTNLNVFSFSLGWRYYFRHPIAFIKDVKYKTIAAYHRIRYGYCDVDVWKLCEWFLTIMPQMLQQLAAGHAYPGTEPFDTPEKWDAWLHKIATQLEELQDENWEKKNEFHDAFHTLGWRDKSEAAEAIRKQWVKRADELAKERKNLIENCMNELGRNFFYLWD